MTRIAPPLSTTALHTLPVAHPLNGTLPALLEHAQAFGHIGAFSDEDGVFRRVPVLVNTGGHALPAFGLAMVVAFLNVSPHDMAMIPGEQLVLRNATWPDQTRRDVVVPLDEHGDLLIQYAGRWVDGPFPYFSFKDVWEAIEEGRVAELREQVEGKMVLILHAGLSSDKRRTPLELKAPGGFVHANIVNTILMGHAPRPVSTGMASLITVVWASFAAFVLLTLRGWKGVLGVMGLAIAYVGITLVALMGDLLVLPVLAPLSGLILGAGGALGWMTRAATHRVERLEAEVLASERELSTTRESLAHHESHVERVMEELELVKTEAGMAVEHKLEITRQVEGLQAELQDAQTQTDSARRHIRELETKLARVTTATVTAPSLSSAELDALRQEAETLGLVTCDTRVLGILRDLKKAAKTVVPILILGETGTGKEVLAKAVHRLSTRATGPFVPVNVAALPPELVESELFGHVRGAFTGADRDRKGYFEQAATGTIFLDEIGDLKPEVQAKLLRVLQDHTFQRVGGTGAIHVDVRVVSATNRELRQGVAHGWFREDLYFRLRGMEFRLPPLRERREDLALLAGRFVQEAAQHAGRPGLAFSQGALDHIKRWAWPGNIRELKSCLERAVILAEGDLITEENLQLDQEPREPLTLSASSGTPVLDVSGDSAVLLALREHTFDMQATAHALGWDRSTVTQRLKGMCFVALVEHHGDRTAAALALAGTPALTRVVEVKVQDYTTHLKKVVANHTSAGEALAECRRRFKNLPDRYLPALESLVQDHFKGR